MPDNQKQRTVLISQRMNKSMQSADSFSHQWQITWKNEARWTDPLMGYTSSADPMSHMKLKFDTREEAIAFAEKSGWTFETLAANSKGSVPAGTYNYAQNFLSKRTSQELALNGMKTVEYATPGYGESHWFQALTYHGDAEVEQHGPPQKQASKK